MTSSIFATTFYRRSSSSRSICSTQRHSPISEPVGGPATADYVIVPWRDRLGTSMAMDQVALSTIQKSIWEGQLPLNITLAPSESRTYDQTDPYLISLPRISYLPSLLPRLKAFFSSSLIEPDASAPHDGWFSFEGVPLKWHYPVGLLYDLYAGADPATKSSEDEYSPTSEAGPLPWRLVVHFSDWPDEELVRLDAEGMVMNDAFINSVKEADFVRNGTAKGIMTLSKDDSSGLWQAVQDVDLPSFQRIMNILLPLNSHQPLRNLPVRLFLPLPPKPDSDSNSPFLKVVQSPIPPTISVTQSQQQMNQSTILSSSRVSGSVSAGMAQPQTQTIGTALHSILPHLFPSRRTPVLAKPVLHGAAVPMSAPVEEVVRCAAYGDGWVYIVVRMMG